MKKIFSLFCFVFIFNLSYSQSDKAYGYYNQSEISIILGEFQKAISLLDQAIAVDRNFYDAYNRRGQCYLQLKKYDEAIADFEKVRKNQKKNANIYYTLGNAYELKKNYEKADEYYAQIHKISEYLARDYGQKQMDKAIRMWNDNEKNRGKALEIFEKAILIDPLSPDLLFFYAEYLRRSNKIPDAMNTLRKLLKFDSKKVDYAEVHFKMATTCHHYCDDQGIDELLEEALKLNPKYSTSVNMYFVENFMKIDKDKRLGYLNRWQKLLPNEYFPKMYFGMYYSELQEFEKALSYYNESIKMDPNFGHHYKLRGNNYFRMYVADEKTETLKKAISDYSKAIDLGAKEDDLYFARGTAKFYLFSDDYELNKKANNALAEDVLTEMNTILKNNPEYAHAYQTRARVNYILNGEQSSPEIDRDVEMHDKYCKNHD